MRRPQNGVYILQSLAPPYQVWVLWRGPGDRPPRCPLRGQNALPRIAGGFVASHAAALQRAQELKSQLAALPVFDRVPSEAGWGEAEAGAERQAAKLVA